MSTSSRTSDAPPVGSPGQPKTPETPETPETTVLGVRAIVASQGRLSVPMDALGDTSDLHDAGLTSLATVSLMLALEEHFDVEFPDALLSRRTFSSIRSLAAAIDGLRAA